jgi:hypothetical protein
MSIGYHGDRNEMPDRKGEKSNTLEQLKEGFLSWVVNGAKEKRVLIGERDEVWTIDSLMNALATCEDRLPPWAAVELGMPLNSTYAGAVRKVGHLSVR